MISFEEFRTKQQRGNAALSRDNLGIMGKQLQNAAIACAADENLQDISSDFMEYSDAFTVLALGIPAPAVKRGNYEKLAGFSAFINGSDAGGVPNIARLAAAGRKSGQDFDLFAMLASLNEALEMGLDMDALKEKARQLPPGEKWEALEDEKEEAPEQAEPEEEEEEAGEDDDSLDEEEEEADLDVNEDAVLSGRGDLIGKKTAAAHIEALRDNGFSEKDPSKLSDRQKELYADRFLKIMAARELADSVRGDKKKLVAAELSAEDIDARALTMKKNGTFSRFLDEVKNDPRKMKAAIAAAGKGHGGGLDDMFKDYVKNQKAAALRNDNILKRYMPTVKERIEILQDQYKNIVDLRESLDDVTESLGSLRGRWRDANRYVSLSKKKKKLGQALEDAGTVERITAEIIQLRNLGHAVKGKKSSLDKPIPVVSGSEPESLSRNAEELAYRDQGVLVDEDVAGLIRSGHGGEMAEKARAMANESLDPEENRKELAIYNENTVGGRLDRLKRNAGKLAKELGQRAEQDAPAQDLMKRSMDLLAETIILDSKVRDPQTGAVLDDQMGKEVPWHSVDKVLSGGPENSPKFRQLFGNLDAAGMADVLNDLNKKGHDGFIKDLAGQKVKEKTEIKQEETGPAVEHNKKMEGQSADGIRI